MRSRDPFWQWIVDAFRPTTEQMAEAEADLQRQGRVPPLDRRTAKGLVERVQGTMPLAVVPRRGRTAARMAATAAILLMSVLSVAWIGPQLFWPEHKATAATHDFQGLIQLALSTDDDNEVINALYAIDAGVGELISRLDIMRQDPELRAPCESLLARLRECIFAVRKPQPGNADFDALMTRLWDGNATAADRRIAIDRIGDLAAAGIDAFRYPMLTKAEDRAQRDSLVDRLRGDLSK